MKPLFSICVITRNEEKTLPRLINSLKDFISRGGDVNVLDTGSTDKTITIAKEAGIRVKEVGEKYLHTIDNPKPINARFLVHGEKEIVKKGDRYFDYSSARNECADMADNDMIFCYDADEVAAVMEIDEIDKLIKSGYTQFEYNFVFAYDQFGNEAIKFVQSKAYNRQQIRWCGIVHELLIPFKDQQPKRIMMDERLYKLSHHQNFETSRHSYLIGLAVDCFNHPQADRQSHYFARELMYNDRPKSAIREFKRHITMNGWVQEKAQSMVHIAHCYGLLNEPAQQAEWLNRAFYTDSSRREPLIELAEFHMHNKNYQAAICYATAAMQIPLVPFYANNMAHYREKPHEILYRAYGWIGMIEAAKEHLAKALEYSPYHPEYLRDTKFYFEYWDQPQIQGWMHFPELQWLYNEAKKHETIVEVGSWKGKSTHALASGCKKGKIYCVDTWKGSADEKDLTHEMGKNEDVLQIFRENLSQFDNVYPYPGDSVAQAQRFADRNMKIDMVFIDAGHTKEEVKRDVQAWLPLANKIICGHDYSPAWPEVMAAVDEMFGKPDGVCDSIWWVNVEKSGKKAEFVKVLSPEDEKAVDTIAREIQKNVPPGDNVIPKKLFTIWLGDQPMSELVERCVRSHILPGYEHTIFIDAPHDVVDNKYLKDAIAAKKWVKASDWMRLYLLYTYGGIYLDADVEVLPGKNFDAFLSEQMFLGFEERAADYSKVVVGNSVIGSVPGHPFLKRLMELMEERFVGDDDKIYESGMGLLNEIGIAYQDKFLLVEPDVFYPYNNRTKETKITENTITHHHFLNSWVEEKLPIVSIVIPHLGTGNRESGLEECLRSIDNMNYPIGLTDVIVIPGEDKTVPEKLKEGVERSIGEYICYAANDMTFEKDCLINAVRCAQKENKALVAFNEGELLPDAGNICTHFLIRKDFIDQLGGEIFDTRLKHVGVDNLLWAKASRLEQAIRCEDAKIVHNHFSKGAEFDEVYEKGWKDAESDRETLKQLMEEI